MFGLVVWKLWNCRNTYIFTKESVDINTLLHLALTEAKKTRQALNQRNATWQKILENVLKLNTNTTVTRQRHLAFGGGIFRDSTGGWVKGFIVSLGYKKLLVECDNLNVVNMLIKGSSSSEWYHCVYDQHHHSLNGPCVYIGVQSCLAWGKPRGWFYGCYYPSSVGNSWSISDQALVTTEAAGTISLESD